MVAIQSRNQALSEIANTAKQKTLEVSQTPPVFTSRKATQVIASLSFYHIQLAPNGRFELIFSCHFFMKNLVKDFSNHTLVPGSVLISISGTPKSRRNQPYDHAELTAFNQMSMDELIHWMTDN
ncbi:hypothetical protein OAF81_01100, partial [bacterium]|nr:hypothetical protein [bacterium]